MTCIQYLTPHHLAPRGLVAQLVEQSHRSSVTVVGLIPTLSPEIFFQINVRTSLYIGLNT